MLKKNLWIIIVIVTFLVVGVAADVFFWKNIATENQLEAARVQAKVDALSTQITAQQANAAALQNNLLALQNKLSQFMMQEQQSSTAQALNEISYLLDIANLYLQINRDIPDAIKSLQLAHQHLQAIAEPSLLPLQQALASDLNSLNDAPKIDAADILLKLQTLSESISRLKLTAKTTASSTNTQSSATTKQPWYKRSLQTLWSDFKNLFVIRHSNSGAPLVPASSQSEWIRENIAFTLAEAQWAVLQQKPVLYQQSLTQVRQWLTEQYPDNPERKQILARVDELIAIDVAPTPPDISASLRAVQQAIKELPLAAPPPVTTPTKPQSPAATPAPSTPAAPPAKPNTPTTGIEI